MKKQNKTNNVNVLATAWNILAASIFVLGASLWSMIGMNVVVSGTTALAVFATLAITSAIGIGIAVSYCAQKAQESN